MPRQQTTMEQVQDAAGQASAAAHKAGERAAAEVSNAASNMQDAMASAKTTAQSYVQEGQRIASEQTTNAQDAAKKAMGTAQNYVDDARKMADPYVDAAKQRIESAKTAAGNARENVAKKAQPYVDSVQSFDITKTAVFHVFTHLVSVLLYVIWRVMAFVPTAHHLVKVAEEKEKDVGVVAACASTAERVPVVGPRTVEVVTIAVKSVRTDLSEQISQYESNAKKQK